MFSTQLLTISSNSKAAYSFFSNVVAVVNDDGGDIEDAKAATQDSISDFAYDIFSKFLAPPSLFRNVMIFHMIGAEEIMS